MFYSDLKEFRAAIGPEQRLLGLDIGEKTIGIALSDTTRRIASPLLTIKRRKFTEDAAELAGLIKKHGIGGLVIGLPLNVDGSEGRKCQSVRQFGRNFLKLMDIAVYFQDERFSTVIVNEAMLEGGLSFQKREAAVDKLAACYILQGMLDKAGGLV